MLSFINIHWGLDPGKNLSVCLKFLYITLWKHCVEIFWILLTKTKIIQKINTENKHEINSHISVNGSWLRACSWSQFFPRQNLTINSSRRFSSGTLRRHRNRLHIKTACCWWMEGTEPASDVWCSPWRTEENKENTIFMSNLQENQWEKVVCNCKLLFPLKVTYSIYY